MAYHQLAVWQKSCDLAVEIYRVTDEGRLARDYGLRDQLRRASVSVPSNIAEGEERESPRDTIRFLFIAKGSLAELITQLWIAEKIGFMPATEATHLRASGEEISRMLRGLIQTKEAQIR